LADAVSCNRLVEMEMDKEKITEVVSFLKESYVNSGISVEAIALFGSALTDRMTPDSDLDLIVISTHFRNLDLFERAKLALKPETETLKKFKIPMDIINLSPEEFGNAEMTIYQQSRIMI
jgi:uncharacterized protein